MGQYQEYPTIRYHYFASLIVPEPSIYCINTVVSSHGSHSVLFPLFINLWILCMWTLVKKPIFLTLWCIIAIDSLAVLTREHHIYQVHHVIPIVDQNKIPKVAIPGKPQVFQWQVDIVGADGGQYTPQIEMPIQTAHLYVELTVMHRSRCNFSISIM